MIKVILIDIDDTLLDFHKCAEQAIRTTCAEQSVTCSDELIREFFDTTAMLWSRIEKGTLTKSEMYKLRWTSIFSKFGIDFDGELFDRLFRANFRHTSIPVDGAREMLSELSGTYRLFAASNASYDQQIERLTRSDLLRYVEKVFTSESVGYVKPSKEFFEQCLKDIGDYEKSEILMLGDSLSADISGGKAYGIKTCYFDRGSGASVTPDVTPDITIKALTELKELIKDL